MDNSNGWRKWTNHILFTLLVTISTGTVILFMLFTEKSRELQFDVLHKSIIRIEQHLTEADKVQLKMISDLSISVTKLSEQVNQNTRDLMLDYKTRMQIYGIGGKGILMPGKNKE